MAESPKKRKTVEVKRVRMPLRSLLAGREIREAAQAVEQFRMKLNEQEILYGCRIKIDWVDYGEVYAVASRPETDEEYAARLEKLRIAAEQKAARAEKRKLAEQQKAVEREQQRRLDALDQMKNLARQLGISGRDLVDILDR